MWNLNVFFLFFIQAASRKMQLGAATVNDFMCGGVLEKHDAEVIASNSKRPFTMQRLALIKDRAGKSHGHRSPHADVGHHLCHVVQRHESLERRLNLADANRLSMTCMSCLGLQWSLEPRGAGRLTKNAVLKRDPLPAACRKVSPISHWFIFTHVVHMGTTAAHLL